MKLTYINPSLKQQVETLGERLTVAQSALAELLDAIESYDERATLAAEYNRVTGAKEASAPKTMNAIVLDDVFWNKLAIRQNAIKYTVEAFKNILNAKIAEHCKSKHRKRVKK